MRDPSTNKGATVTKEGEGEECMKGEQKKKKNNPQKVRKKRRPGQQEAEDKHHRKKNTITIDPLPV